MINLDSKIKQQVNNIRAIIKLDENTVHIIWDKTFEGIMEMFSLCKDQCAS